MICNDGKSRLANGDEDDYEQTVKIECVGWDANYNDPRRMVGQLKWVHCSSHLGECRQQSSSLQRSHVMRDRCCCHKCNAVSRLNKCNAASAPDWTSRWCWPIFNWSIFRTLNLTWNQGHNMYLTTFSNSNDNSEDEENSPEGEDNCRYFDLEMLSMCVQYQWQFVHFVALVSVHVIRRCGAMLKSGLAVSCLK